MQLGNLSSHLTSNSKVSDPVGPGSNFHGRQKSDSSSIGSRRKSDASSRKSETSINNSLATTAKSANSSSKAGKLLKIKKHTAQLSKANTVSNMLAIDGSEEFVTIHGDSADIGREKVVIPIDGSMTATDLIADTLDECNISLSRMDDYCLYDVIGRECEGLWLTDYTRSMNDTEKPLLLISMMKPSEGLSRRFEIKNEALAPDPVDGLAVGSKESRREAYQSGEGEGNEANFASHHLFKFPRDCPYFLTVGPYNANRDAVLHLITNATSIVGSSEDKDKCTIRLYAPDVHQQHCWVCKEYDTDNETKYKYISIAPFPGAYVRVNDKEISSKVNIFTGDIITIGQHYIFLFKDPTAASKDTTSPESTARLTPESEEAQLPHSPAHAGPTLSFTPNRQQELLTKVFATMSHSEAGYKLTPAYLLILALEHSLQAMDASEVSEFVSTLCSEFQVTVLVSNALYFSRCNTTCPFQNSI